MRTPLWQQRKRASDLLVVASRFGSFPVLLETYRECLRDYFDMPSLVETLRRINDRTLSVTTVDSKTPSPFAASLLFSYVANYIYDGDAPLAERRAQALSVDQAQLRELLGDAELRELLDRDALIAIERQLQYLDDKYKVRSLDGLHDLLIRIGDLTLDEIQERSQVRDIPAVVGELERAKRIVPLPIAGERRYVAVEDVARYRETLGVPLPQGLPAALLEPVRDPAADLAMRYARSHAPFTSRELAARYGLGVAVAEGVLLRLVEAGRLIEGEFRPGGSEREFCDPDVLRSLRRRSLAKLRQEVEPVDADALGRFAVAWHGIGGGRRGLEPLLDTIEQLQGAPIAVTVLEREILPARVEDYEPGMLDVLMGAGEVVWVGMEPLGERDGRIALYLTDHLLRLRSPAAAVPTLGGRAAETHDYLREHGASFFSAIHEGTGGGFPGETVDALWDLVWKGIVTNDTLHPLRAYVRPEEKRTRRKPSPFRSRRLVPPTAEGRWSLIQTATLAKPVSRSSSRIDPRAVTEWSAAMATQLLARYGLVTREIVASEAVAGGFSSVYEVLRAMENTGRVRRGYFVAGLGAAQFAIPTALDLLRSMRDVPEHPRTVALAATDPANPYGALTKWPDLPQLLDGARGPTRTAGALVILVDGAAAAYLKRGDRELLLFLPQDEPRRSRIGREVARMLLHLAASRGMLISEINGEAATAHAAARLFVEEGFAPTAMGLQARTDKLRPRGYGSLDPHGIGIAAVHGGGSPMAEQKRPEPDPTVMGTSRPRAGQTDDDEHKHESNDRDQMLERGGQSSRQNRGYDEAVRGGSEAGDIDPDSATSEIDRDEEAKEP
jgi:ATP-dependent helicase Lhr and Lhr-like helicase